MQNLEEDAALYDEEFEKTINEDQYLLDSAAKE